MVYDAAHQQHLEWLQAQLAQQDSKLAEAQAIVAQLQESVAYFRNAIAVVRTSEPNLTLTEKLPEQSSFTTNGTKEVVGLVTENGNLNGGETASIIISDNEDSDLKDDREGKETEEANKRSPKDMLLAEFREQTLGDIAEKKLKASGGKPLSSDELTEMIFETRSKDEYFRARNSLSAELRRGAKEGRWKKDGRGIFVIDVQPEANILSTEPQQRLYTLNSAKTLDS
jgi:hypothetical protein